MINPTIAVCMIVRNEAHQLADCLDSVKDVVNEIVIVDTGSTDNTVEIACRYTTAVYQFPWNGDFAAARNFALERVTAEWVLSLDADELLVKGETLAELINQPQYEAFLLPLHTEGRGGANSYDRFMVVRLFKRHHRFKGLIHEQVIIDDPASVGFADNPIIRHRISDMKERRSKRGRNLRLLRRALSDTPDNPYLHYYYGVEWLGLGQFTKAISHFERALGGINGLPIFSGPTIRNLIACYVSTGQLDKALCLCLVESQQHPLYTDLFYDGGIVFALKGEYKMAIRWLQHAIELGQPPLVYYHTDGTDGYLSYYQIGCCLEQLGKTAEARTFFLRGIGERDCFIESYRQLIMEDVVRQGPAKAMQWIYEADAIIQSEIAAVGMAIFWEQGNTDYATRCLGYIEKNDQEFLEIKVSVLTFGGRPREAVATAQQLRTLYGKLSLPCVVAEIIAMLLLEQASEAREQTLVLWREVEQRQIVHTLLHICLAMQKDQREDFAIVYDQETLLLIYDNCMKSWTADEVMRKNYGKLASIVEFMLTSHASPSIAFDAYLAQQVGRVKGSLQQRWRSAEYE